MHEQNNFYFEKRCNNFWLQEKVVQPMSYVSRPFLLQTHILNYSQVSAKSNRPSPTGVPSTGPVQQSQAQCGFPDGSPWSKGSPRFLLRVICGFTGRWGVVSWTSPALPGQFLEWIFFFCLFVLGPGRVRIIVAFPDNSLPCELPKILKRQLLSMERKKEHFITSCLLTCRGHDGHCTAKKTVTESLPAALRPVAYAKVPQPLEVMSTSVSTWRMRKPKLRGTNRSAQVTHGSGEQPDAIQTLLQTHAQPCR